MTKEEERITKPERIRMLFRKQKKLIGTQIKTVPVREPIAHLHRRSGDVEFYEGVTKGKWTITHSDGGNRVITINPSDQETFDYGGQKLRGYDCHEDAPTAGGWKDPIVTIEEIAISQEKTAS